METFKAIYLLFLNALIINWAIAGDVLAVILCFMTCIYTGLKIYELYKKLFK